MEAIKQIVRIPANHEIRIAIPPDVPENDLVEVIVIFRKKIEAFQQKIHLLKTAMHDEHFLHDLQEISEDFEPVDLEDWGE